MTPGAEPIGCPTPGACSCPRAALTAPAVQAALEQLRDAVTIFAPDVDLRADLLAKLAIVATACEQAESRAARLDQCIADGQRMAGYLEAAEQRAEKAEAQAEELRAVVLEKSHRCLELAQRAEQAEAREGALEAFLRDEGYHAPILGRECEQCCALLAHTADRSAS